MICAWNSRFNNCKCAFLFQIPFNKCSFAFYYQEWTKATNAQMFYSLLNRVSRISVICRAVVFFLSPVNSQWAELMMFAWNFNRIHSHKCIYKNRSSMRFYYHTIAFRSGARGIIRTLVYCFFSTITSTIYPLKGENEEK